MAAVVGLEDIQRARTVIDGVVAPTPVLSAGAISRWAGTVGEIDRFDAGFFGVSPPKTISTPRPAMLVATVIRARCPA